MRRLIALWVALAAAPAFGQQFKPAPAGSGVVVQQNAPTFARERNHTISVQQTTTAATAGGNLTLTAGKSKTSGAGGTAALVGGAGDTTGAGGPANVTGGAGGSTSGTGGAVAITGGAGSAGNANGGAVTINGGAPNGSGTRGTVALQSALAVPAGGSAPACIAIGTSGPKICVGSGVPTVSSTQGSLYLRTDGSSGSTRAYINSDGGTTWVAVTTGS